MKSRKLSVIVPMGSVGEDIPSCLDCILAQEMDLEILCVTADAATAKKMQKKQTKIHFLSVAGGTIGALCNYGLQKASGKYVAFLSPGDVIKPEMYQEMYRLAVRQRLDIIQSGIMGAETMRRKQADFCGYVLRLSNEENWWELIRPLGCGIYSNEFLSKNKISFPAKINGDVIPSRAFLLRAFLKAERTYFMQEEYYKAVASTECMGRAEVLLEEYRSLKESLQTDASGKEHAASLTVKAALGDFLVLVQALPSFYRGAFLGKVAEYFRSLHEAGGIDYYSLRPDEHLAISRIMLDTKSFREDALLGATPRRAMEFIFPYHLFPRGSRVVIYAAGNVGRQFYRQAVRDHYVEIVGIVDKNAAWLATEDLPVKPVDAMKGMDYDYVLIAIREQEIAEAAKQELLKVGVPYQAICWDGTCYFCDDFHRSLYFPALQSWNSVYGKHEDMLQEFQRKLDGANRDHIFPYHLFSKGTKVVLCGAGDVGKKFYRQATKDGYVQIVGVVDADVKNLQPSDLPVKPLEALAYMDYDKVLISIRGGKFAAEVRKLLLKQGVPGEKICWDGEVYWQDDFYRKMYLPMMDAWNSARMPGKDFQEEFGRKMKASVHDHVFPYHLFHEGAKVALYVVGEIGRKFCLQAKHDQYISIAGIVAKEPEALRSSDFPVEPVAALESMDYDAVLIAIHGKEGAEAAKKYLVEQGIPEEKIKWDGDVYWQSEFYWNIWRNLLRAWGEPVESHEELTKGIVAKIKASPQDYVFPYHLFHEGEKIALYGAGEAGKAFWHMAREFNWVKVVAVVDPKADKVHVRDMPVAPVQALKQFKFDSVLVTLPNKEDLQEAREKLLRIGITEDRVKWAGKIYQRNDFYKKYWFDYLRFVHEMRRSKI